MSYLLIFFVLSNIIIAVLNTIIEKENDVRVGVFSYLSIILFILIVSQIEYFSDTVTYIDYFKYFDIDKFNIGFYFYTSLFSYIGNVSLYIVSFPVFLLAGHLFLANKIKNTNSYILLSLLTLSPIFLAYSTTGYRQTLAMAAGAVFIGLLINNKKIWAVFFLIFAISFHSTAVIFTPILLLFVYNLNYRYLLFIWILSLGFGYFELSRGLEGVDLLIDYLHYFDSNYGTTYQKGLRVDFIAFSLVPIILTYLYGKKNQLDFRYLQLLKAYILLNLIANIFSFIPYSDRIYSYSWILIPVIVSFIFSGLHKIVQVLYLMILISLFIFYNLQWIYK
jgi:hypothetical protein